MLVALLLAHGARTARSPRQPDLDWELRDHMRKDDDRGLYLEPSEYVHPPQRSRNEEGLDLQSSSASFAENTMPSIFTEVGAKMTNPNEKWHFCAEGGKECSCAGGMVRFGRKTSEQEVWTYPTLLGRESSVTCSLDALQAKRVKMPDKGNVGEPNQCQCIERVVRVSTEVMSFLQVEEVDEDFGESFPPKRGQRRRDLDDEEDDDGNSLESLMEEEMGAESEEGDTPAAEEAANEIQEKQGKATAPKLPKPSGPGPWKMCMTVPVPDIAKESRDNKEISAADEASVKPTERMINLELAEAVYMKKCEENDDEVWTYLMSSGQLRHSGTGKCLAVHFEGAKPILRANDCILVESPDLTQRWSVDFYQGTEFSKGSGQIRLQQGATSANSYCLTTSAWDTPSLEKCSASAATWHFESPSQVGKHQWSECGTENEKCQSCTGEIKFGNADLEAWTKAVPVPNELDEVADVKCTLDELQDIALHDPVLINPREQPEYRECQCNNGETGLPKVGLETSGGGGSMVGVSVGVGAAVLLCGVGAVVYLQKKKKGEQMDGEHEEEEEWEEEEEYEEEYEEG